MPTIVERAKYDAIFQAAKEILRHPNSLNPIRETLPQGTTLYRYVNYRDGAPQVESAGRTQWCPSVEDKENRWTGVDSNGRAGHQGLYLSGEFYREDKPFPELEHYTRPPATAGQEQAIEYLDYHDLNAEPTQTEVSSLKSMFAFASQEPQVGLDLTLDNGAARALFEEILGVAQATVPNAFGNTDAVESLYLHETDACFCRAIGNAMFDIPGVAFIRTSSARDDSGLSTNVVFKCETTDPQRPGRVDVLNPLGRATYFYDEATRRARSVFTLHDLEYNAQLGAPPAPIPSLAEQTALAVDMTRRAIEDLQEQLRTLVAGDEADQTVTALYERLHEIRQTLTPQMVLDAIPVEELHELSSQIDTMTTQAGTTTVDLGSRGIEAGQAASESLAALSEAVEQQRRRVSDQDGGDTHDTEGHDSGQDGREEDASEGHENGIHGESSGHGR